MSDTMLEWGVVLLAVFWLLVLPYFLLVGILHKLGYHALCRMKCDVQLQAQHVRRELDERFRAGMRQGIRGAATFGTDETWKMVEPHSLLPEWAPKPGDDDFEQQVKARYRQIRFAFDVTDDLAVAVTALSVALGVAVRQADDPADALQKASNTAADYAGIATGA